MITAVYSIVAVPDPASAWDRAYDVRAVHRQAADVLAVAPKGATVWLVVGTMLPTIIPSDDYWVELVRGFDLRIEGDPYVVQNWMRELTKIEAAS